MQRVPQIRIFGSSGYQWRKSSIDNNDRKFVDTWTTSVSTPFTFTKTYYQKQPEFNRTQASYMKRSNSVSRLTENSKPFETNYYANAIKICENNRVMNSIKGHGIEYLNSSYIVKGCRRPLKSECPQCQAQARKGLLVKQNCKGFHTSSSSTINKQQNFNSTNINNIKQNEQNSYRTNKQSETNYMNFYEQEQLSSNRNKILQSKQNKNSPNLMKTTHSEKKIVSFQEIIDSATQIKQPTFGQIQQPNKQLHMKQISTQKSFVDKQNTTTNKQTKVIIIESKCESMNDREQNKRQQKRSKIQQSCLLPEISCLINELNLIGSLGEVETTSFMLDELKQAARKDLQVRKNCINRLDEIIGKYGSVQKQIPHIRVLQSK